MTVAPGTKLGPYEIIAPIGAGGMGEVYRARDTRLDRTVAIKVLPPHLSDKPDVRQRFEREARAISSLSHPNICPLYDIGHQDGIDYLVMEFLEGETLANRLAKGPLPTEQVLRYGIEIAEGLEKAHRTGVVHRDLKPSNIMLTKTGARLVDFGLAKPGPLSTSGSTGLTLTSPVASQPLTQEGVVVGTFQYMSPEQVEGKEADARSDIFAMGAVLYEMVTGRKAFQGRSHLSVISAVLEREPDPISAIQPLTPPVLEQVIRECLAKDPDDRWQSAHDVALQLKPISEAGSQAVEPARAGRKGGKLKALAIGGWSLLALAAAATLVFWPQTVAPNTIVAEIRGPEGYTLPGVQGGNQVAVSPDGKAVAFVAVDKAKRSLWVRHLDAASPRVLSGTEGAIYPFWSPDSRFIGFFADKKVKKIDAAGGVVQTICDAADGRGGTWNADGMIVFAPDIRGPLYRISEGGGNPVAVTILTSGDSNTSHREPVFLPDGHHFLFVSSHDDTVFVGSLSSAEKAKAVVEKGSNAFFSNGYVLYVREGNLLAQRFDLRSLQVSGNPVAVASHIDYAALRSIGNFSVSNNGVLVYREAFVPDGQFVWFDPTGKSLGVLGEAGAFRAPHISPDGHRAVVPRFDPQTGKEDLWLMDPGRATFSRFTFEPHDLYEGVWSPDGKEIAVSAADAALTRRAANGSGQPEVLIPPSNVFTEVTDWSRDGRQLLLLIQNQRTGTDIFRLPLQGDHRPVPVVQTEFNEDGGKLSPDGRLLAYSSNESGRYELYVTEFPGPGGRWQVSSGGISRGPFGRPIWHRDGQSIYYVDAMGKLVVVNLGKGKDIKPGSPRTILSLPRGITGFDVAPDGRFLVLAPLPQDTSPAITLVVNWEAGIGKR